MAEPYTIYYTGGLFDAKELVGNALLAHYLEKVSNGKYRCLLAQNCEQASSRAADIRNQDLRMVIGCDLGIFNFDGTDLDSGTVIEFMSAKTFDIPSLLLRTDFRHSGDSNKDSGDPWNLMASSWPRTNVLWVPGMAVYQQHFKEDPGELTTAAHQPTLRDPFEAQKTFYDDLARKMVAKLDDVVTQTPVHQFRNREEAVEFFGRTLSFAGPSFVEGLPAGFAESLVDRKIRQKLIAFVDEEED